MAARAGAKDKDRKRLVPAPDRQGVRGPGPAGMAVPHDRAILAQMRGPVDAVVKRLKAGDTRMVISPDSPFFRYFTNPLGTGGKADKGK